MRDIKIVYDNGDVSYTRINGTREEILAYYIGKKFNLGSEADHIVTAQEVYFLDEED